MSLADLPLTAVLLWWNRGVRSWTLTPKDVSAPNGIESALASSVVAGGAVLGIQYVILRSNNGSVGVIDIWTLGLPLALNSVLFVSGLLISLRMLCGPAKPVAIASATMFVLAGLLPIICALSWEQFDLAIKMFQIRQDPSNPYLSAAIRQTLEAPEVSTAWRIRAWVTVGLQVFAVSFYLFWCLPRILLRVLPPRTIAWVRVVAAIIITLVAYTSLVQLYAGRLYWHLVGMALEAR